MRDLMNNIQPVVAIAPTIAADDTALVSAIIDVQGYGSATFIIATGTLADTDATFSVLVEHADKSDFSDGAAVPDTELIGTEAEAGFTFADDNKTRKIGYAGIRQFVRLTVTPAGNAGNAPVAAVAVLGHPHLSPTSNPPA